MRNRRRKQIVLVVAAVVLFGSTVPLGVFSAVWDLPGLSAFAAVAGMACIIPLVFLSASSSALTHDYGLWGDKDLFVCPESLKVGQPIRTWGTIAERCRGTILLNWSVEGVAVTLPSNDVVFIDKKNI